MNEEDKLRQRSVVLYFARFRLKNIIAWLKEDFSILSAYLKEGSSILSA